MISDRFAQISKSLSFLWRNFFVLFTAQNLFNSSVFLANSLFLLPRHFLTKFDWSAVHLQQRSASKWNQNFSLLLRNFSRFKSDSFFRSVRKFSVSVSSLNIFWVSTAARYLENIPSLRKRLSRAPASSEVRRDDGYHEQRWPIAFLSKCEEIGAGAF